MSHPKCHYFTLVETESVVFALLIMLPTQCLIKLKLFCFLFTSIWYIGLCIEITNAHINCNPQVLSTCLMYNNICFSKLVIVLCLYLQLCGFPHLNSHGKSADYCDHGSRLFQKILRVEYDIMLLTEITSCDDVVDGVS